MVRTRKKAFKGIRKVGWTLPKRSENGRPRSRANAQVKRETDASEEKRATRPFQHSINVRTVAPPFEPVAWRRISMTGYPVGVLRALTGSPMHSRRMMTRMNVWTPLIRTDSTMLWGILCSAFFTSSLMWMTPSNAGTDQRCAQGPGHECSRTWEGKRRGQQTDTPWYGCVGPPSELRSVVGLGEDVLPRAASRHGEQDDNPHNPKQCVGDATHDLDGAEDLACENIAESRHGQKCQGEQSPVPVLRNVAVIVQDDEALNKGADEEGGRRNDCHPAENGDPALDQAPERRWSETSRCVQSGPPILGADSRIDRSYLGHWGGDSEITGPAEEGAVDKRGLPLSATPEHAWAWQRRSTHRAP